MTSLTGTPFLAAAFIVAVLAVLVPLFVWGRVGGPVVVRGAVRLVMVMVAQTSAIVAVFVAVNDQYGLYDNWGDLLGTESHVTAAPDLGADGTGGRNIADSPRVRQTFTPVTDDPDIGPDLRRTHLKGELSGAEGEVYVWLPPQYDDPAYKNKDFPVVELLAGYPGSARDWWGNLDVQTQLRPMTENGEATPFILVSPRTTLLPGQDTGCVNVPGVVNADTWLSVDVRKMVTDNFRAQKSSAGWAVAGFSAGAHCAAKLALEHPDRFRAGIGFSGYNDPGAEPSSVAAHDTRLRRETNPLWIIAHAKTPPLTSLYLTGEPADGYNDGLALQRAAKAPTSVTAVRTTGGHRVTSWKPLVPQAFRWLSGVLDGPVPSPPPGGPRPSGAPASAHLPGGRPAPHGPGRPLATPSPRPVTADASTEKVKP
ncbi:esterase family protein [Streptomyces sp. CBMA152]|uniref:alpha/beta hydrolase n=1 Tax=Streptomyces sp. CBMA152 TaxID=1896312 RepID=UPI00166139D9|nr:alpha/beta hydrolase-fold protein [Streptomyces sp. CBMA152]MBD0745508.1 esterase [Streptomyces sp. CBMA152]